FNDLATPLKIGGTALFDIGRRKVDVAINILSTFADQFGKFAHYALNERRAADGLLHSQLAAFHFARQAHFTLTSEQRHRTHFTEVHPYRVVCVDRLLYGLSAVELLILNFFRMKEVRVLIERER